MGLIYIIDDDWSRNPIVYTDYEAAKADFFITIRQDIFNTLQTSRAIEDNLRVLEEYIPTFDFLDTKNVAIKHSFAVTNDYGNVATTFTFTTKMITEPVYRILIVAWDGDINASLDSCLTAVIEKPAIEVRNVISFEKDIWNDYIIPLGKKAAKENCGDEPDEELRGRATGTWFIIRSDVYLTESELFSEFKKLSVVEFVKRYTVQKERY